MSQAAEEVQEGDCDHRFCGEFDFRDLAGRRLCAGNLHAVLFVGSLRDGSYSISPRGTHRMWAQGSVGVDMDFVELVYDDHGYEEAKDEFDSQFADAVKGRLL